MLDRNEISAKLQEGAENIGKRLQTMEKLGIIESSYIDLEIDYMLEILVQEKILVLDIVERNRTDYYWLGARRQFIDDFVRTLKQKIDEGEAFKIAIFNVLEIYNQRKLNWIKNKIIELSKSGPLYHGSTNKIYAFERRIGSAGDRIPLIYFTANYDFALCFIMNNDGLTKHIRNIPQQMKKYMNFQGHSLETLIKTHDISGYMHVLTDTEKEKFGVGYSKTCDEFCSTEATVKPTKIERISSALNAIILNGGMRVFNSRKNIQDITVGEAIGEDDDEITPKRLLETRQRIIDELNKKPKKDREEIALLDRLKDQQLDAIRIFEEQGENITHVNKLLLQDLRKIYKESERMRQITSQ